MSRPGKVSETEFHTLWNHFAQEGKIKADLRDRLGLTSERPLDTRRARAKGFDFLGQAVRKLPRRNGHPAKLRITPTQGSL
jgi:hypothetical protein